MDKSQITLVAMAIFCWLALWYMLAMPAQWSRFVDKENDFWVSKGLISPTTAQRFRKFEKGLGQKILWGCGAAVSTVGFLLIRFLTWRHTYK